MAFTGHWIWYLMKTEAASVWGTLLKITLFDKPLRRKRKLAAWNTAELERILFGLPGETN
jgi:hypothetical protein